VNVVSIRGKGVRGYLRHFREPYAFLTPNEFVIQCFARPGRWRYGWGKPVGRRLDGHDHRPDARLRAVAADCGMEAVRHFIGLLQALIFTILTIIYFGEAVVGNEADPH